VVNSILVVDDEAEMREMLVDLLRDGGFEATAVEGGAAMTQALDQGRHALVIIDLRLKGEDGLTLARNLRARSSVPIMILTGKADDTDRILGLELAADDYVMKPFNPRELLARVRALLRRSVLAAGGDAGNRERCAFGDWVLDLDARRLFNAQGEACALTPGEYQLLEVFVRHPNRVLSREQLLDFTRSEDSEVFDRTVDVLVVRLRRKIEPNPRQPRYIRTERGVGYAFSATVTRVA